MRIRLQKFLPLFFFFLLAFDLYLIIFYAPEEAIQGKVQKIFYFHVSSAFAMYGGFSLAGLFALFYLVQREILWDALSRAGGSVGLLFCSMVLVSGPLWAKPIWGTWWTWDPRLTTTLMIWLIFASILLLRRFFGNTPKGRMATAILTLFGILDLPLIFLAVKLWRGIHPSVLGGGNNMPHEMRLTLIVSNLTVLFLFGLLYWVQVNFFLTEEKIENE